MNSLHGADTDVTFG